MRLDDPFFNDGAHIGVRLDGARALFTTRRGGVSEGPFRSLNLGRTVGPSADPEDADDPGRVAANRRVLAEQVGIAPARFAHGRQVHGARVARVTAPPAGDWGAAQPGAASADGQATPRDGVATVVLVADCLPIALAAPGAVAMVHAGWRGLAGGVLAAGVAAVRALGRAGDVVAAIGPGAGRCCYEVGDEVRAAFPGHDADVHEQRRIDLKLIAARELRRAGVEAVHDAGLCTICGPELFFSHRRDGGLTGRQAGVAWRA